MKEAPYDVEPCVEWEFDNSTFGNTITTEFGLVCGRAYLRTIYQSTYMFGSFIAAPIGGILSDKYGRKFIFSIGAVLFFVFSMIACWLPDVSSILVFRFLMGLMHTAAMNAGYILGMEVCAPSLRSVIGVMVALPWAIGTILWGGFAYFIRDWRWLQLTVSLPTIILLPALWYMDESPRWLAVRGQHDRALAILKRAARWNGSTLPPDHKIRKLMEITQSQASSAPEETERMELGGTKGQILLAKLQKFVRQLFILFRTPRLRLITLIVWLDFLLSSTVFFGLSLNGVNFSANPYIYMMIGGAMEIPAYLLSPFIAERLGRKIPTLVGYFSTSVCLLILPFISNDMSWLVMFLAMAGKLALSAAFQLLFLYSAELFPTEVRLQGFGSGIFVSRAGGIISPFITDLLGSKYDWAPSVVFGVFSALTAFVTLTLPETLNRPLPETIVDLENAASSKRKKKGRRRNGLSDDVEVEDIGKTAQDN